MKDSQSWNGVKYSLLNELKGLVKGSTAEGEGQPLPPLDVDPETAGDQLPPSMQAGQLEPDAPKVDFKPVSPEQARRWIRKIFEGGRFANGMLDIDAQEHDHDHWIATEDELDFIAPLMSDWANEHPPIANAINELETKGAPAILGGMVAFRQIKSLRIRRERRRNQNYDHFTSVAATTGVDRAGSQI